MDPHIPSKLRVLQAVAIAGGLLAPSSAAAQDVSDADTLPRNVGGIILRPGTLLGSGGMRFGPGWRLNRESFLADFSDLNLAEVIAGENAESVKRLLGDLGTTKFQADQLGFGLQIAAAYGVTDRLTFAAILPWQYTKYQFEAWLEPTVPKPGEMAYPRSNWAVKDPMMLDCPGGQFQIDEDFDQIVEYRGAPYEFNIGDVRKAFTSKCLGYQDPLDTQSIAGDTYTHAYADRVFSGFRDMIFGAKYKVFHGRSVQLAAIGYVIAPTGQVEHPDDLFLVRFGDGTWNAALLAGITVPMGKFRIFGSAGYEYVFSDTHERRMRSVNFNDDLEYKLARGEITEQQLFDEHLDDGSIIPITTKYDRAIVERKLGDNIYVYSGASYDVLEWLNIGIRLDFWHHFRDHITSIGPRFGGTPPYATEAEIRSTVDMLVADGTVPADTPECFQDLARNCKTKELVARLRDSVERRKASYAWHTVRGQVIGGIGIGINTLGPFVRGEFPLPIIGGISASVFLAGQNIDITDQIALSLVIPLPIGDVKDPAEYGFDDEGAGLPWP